MRKTRYLIMSGLLSLSVLFTACKKEKEAEPEPEEVIKPLAVVTGTSSNVTGTRVSLSAEVTGDGGSTILERGFCGGTSSGVTLLANNKFTTNGKIGSFVVNYNGLLPYTQYYVKSFVRTSQDTAYGNEITFNTGNVVVGDYYWGGYIFYINGSNVMVADSSDTPSPGGCIYIGGAIVQTDSLIGSGQANTTAFVNYATTYSYGLTNNAIGVTNSSTSHGYSDWFLPSYEELKLMYTVLKANGIGNFSNSPYWSSSPYYGNPGNIINVIDFTNGSSTIYSNSNSSPKTRAIRSFTISG